MCVLDSFLLNISHLRNPIPMIKVVTPSRLHLTLIDLNAEIGRVDGGAGITLEYPGLEISASKADNIEVIGNPLLAGKMQKAAQTLLPTGEGIKLHINDSLPDHGVIYSHPLINTAPWWVRGKVARAVASKLSLAARIDFYSGEKDPSLTEKLEAKVLQIRTLNPRPPQKRQESGAKPKKRRRK